MRIIIQGAAIGFLLVLTSCSAGSEAAAGQCDANRAQLSIPAERAARDAWKVGDRRLLAVQGYSVEIPGNIPKLAVDRLGYKVMPATSDNWADESCRVYQDEAVQFAVKYNAAMVQLAGGK